MPDVVYSNFLDQEYAERSPDDRREDIAKMLLWGIFLLFLFLSSILAILVFNNNQNATLFKDVFLTYTGIASGIAVSIVSFYYKYESKK